ncbi:dual oxidase maturation factor 1-like [Branchiostoma lanceolatum]|uniref:dual oxidase maturation factor 1-like n=1 Tax=Branchiostoma lanceolatum TaxID=7740 RepID=UPI0034517ACD
MSSSLYQAFRVDGGPTQYAENRTPVTADVLEVGLVFAIAILAFSFLVILPGVRGMQRLYFAVMVFFSIFVMATIMVSNFGMEWEKAEVHTKVQYKAFIAEEMDGMVGVKIGLRAVNITLKGSGKGALANEEINYNERFHYGQDGQGRIGFGPYASLINREFRAAQFRGLPYPILWVAEYFTLDGEDIRWHRSYRLAGYYTLIMLWTAFPLWIITNILFCMFIRYGAYFMMLTGGVMLLGNALFHFLRFGPVLAVPMGTATLVFHYGWCFWLNLVVGSVTLVLGAAILFLDLRFPDVTSTFFSVGSDPDEYYTVKKSLTRGLAPTTVSLPAISEEVAEMSEQKSDSTIARPHSGRPTSGLAVFQKPRRKIMAESDIPV